VNFSSYIEKFSTLFMDIGRSAPRYQTMALLYPQSRSLQSQLYEYLIVVVGLCRHLFNFTRMPTFRQVTSALNDSDLKTFQKDLDRWAISIKEEIFLKDAEENSRFRALSSKLSKSAGHQQKLATNLRVLNFCSDYDHEPTWKQTRKVGNTALFTSLAKYQEWKDYSSSCTLLYTGKLGSGKSVLLANIVDDLSIHAREDTIIVAYFFARYDIPNSLKARTIIGSLARQLLCTLPDLTMVAEECGETRSTENTEVLLKTIFRSFPPGHKAYFVLDGLDECEDAEREVVVQGLNEIQHKLKLQLLISFRVEPNNGLESITKRLAVTRLASIPEDNPDIEAFIEAELERCLENKKLVIGHPTLILEIQDALLKGSQGMFLWVSLQIQSLCDMRTDQAIRDALADLPKDLSETFSRILHKSGRLGQPYQTQLLQLVVAAYRPLTIDELREALSVVPGDTVWTESRLLNDVHSVLACCGCLLTVDEEEATVRFVHHSVKQFLLTRSSDLRKIAFTAEKAQRAMADIIVTYLSYGIFRTELSKTRVPPVVIESAPSHVVRTAIGSSNTVQAFALKLLKSRKQPSFDISKTLAEARKPFWSKTVEEFRFYSYARVHWLRHIFYVSGQEMTMYGLSVRLIDRWVLESDVTANDWAAFAWAANNGNEGIAKRLVELGKVNANWIDRDGRTWLSLAAENGHEAVVKLLLSTDKVDVDLKDQSGRTPLSWAAGNGNKAAVKLLLSTVKVDINVEDQSGQTPLLRAAEGGHEAVFLLLSTWKGDVKGQMPLLWAAQNGHESVVKLLLSTGKIEVDSKDHIGRTPLSWAARNGHEGIFKLLLSTGKVDVDSKDQIERTPLSWAARNGHEGIFKLLLSTEKVDVDSKDQTGRTPLSCAAEEGHEAVVKLLLSTGKVGVDSKDQSGRTPLTWAAGNGHKAVVKLLRAYRV
jgi:ankyrin repeat protein